MFKNRDPFNTKRPVSFPFSLLLFFGDNYPAINPGIPPKFHVRTGKDYSNHIVSSLAVCYPIISSEINVKRSFMSVKEQRCYLIFASCSWREQAHCMVMRINLDCNACCRKMRRILLRMKGKAISKSQSVVCLGCLDNCHLTNSLPFLLFV